VIGKINYEPVGKALKEVLREAYSGHRIHANEPVETIEINVPIRALTVDEALAVGESYIRVRCNGDLAVARNNRSMWIGHVIINTIPKADDLIKALWDGNYIACYSENLVFTLLYKAILRINPELAYENIPWPGATQPKKSKLDFHKRSVVERTNASVSLLRQMWVEHVDSGDAVVDHFDRILELLRDLVLCP
jgi:hypothetical protein